VLARLGALHRTSDPAKSLDYYRRAAEIEPANANYATGYAAALVQARRFAEAALILRRVVTDSPDHYAAHANLATALDELGQFAEALKEYEWLKRARPDLALIDFLIGIAYDRLGEFRLALVAYESFLARADAQKNQLEIEKVNLRLPSLRNQIKSGQGAKKKT
jgi:tetratricopeptide (TPR) repeat protein